MCFSHVSEGIIQFKSVLELVKIPNNEVWTLVLSAPFNPHPPFGHHPIFRLIFYGCTYGSFPKTICSVTWGWQNAQVGAIDSEDQIVQIHLIEHNSTTTIIAIISPEKYQHCHIFPMVTNHWLGSDQSGFLKTRIC